MTITEFLLARTAEDEDRARTDGAHAMSGHMWKHYPADAYDELQDRAIANARRTVAECQAKRAIVELHSPEAFQDAPNESFCSHDQRTAGIWPCPTIRILTAVYADHPDYRAEEWRP